MGGRSLGRGRSAAASSSSSAIGTSGRARRTGAGIWREAGQGDGALVGPVERHPAGEALGQDDRQRVEVGAPVDEVPLDLLGRDILRGTEQHTIVAQLVDGEHRASRCRSR